MSLGQLDVLLLGTVALASVVGSLHCALMCGPLVSACLSTAAARSRTEATYHLARGASYITLGAGAGALGAAVDWAGRGAGIARAGAITSGVLVVLAGLFWILPGPRAGLGPRVGSASLSQRWLGRGLVQLRRKRPSLRAGLLGLLTPALPCGYLYAFVLAAAGTGSWGGGALLMGAFWLGTLPALVLVGLVVGRLSAAIRKRVPLATGVLLVAIGILGVLGRGLSPAPGMGRNATRTPEAALDALGRGEGHEHTACH